MRTTALVLALAASLVAGTAHADEPDVLVPVSLLPSAVAPAQRPSVDAYLRERQDEARRLRNAGIATTVIGSVMTLVGVGLFMHGFCMDSCQNGDDGTFEIGTALIALGQGGVLTGIPIWAVGQTRVSRGDERRLSLGATSLTLQF